MKHTCVHLECNLLNIYKNEKCFEQKLCRKDEPLILCPARFFRQRYNFRGKQKRTCQNWLCVYFLTYLVQFTCI
jgi:hypothetical protein